MKKHVKARRERLAALAEYEIRARCHQCHRVLAKIRLDMGESFCDLDCAEEWAEIQERYAEAKARGSR